MAEQDAQARNRWLVITLLRLAGVAMVVFGLLIVQGVFDANPLIGYALLVIGLVDAFVMPLVLARKWRTPPKGPIE